MIDGVTTSIAAASAPQSAAQAAQPATERFSRYTLTEEERLLVAEMAARDREVRAHENAHATVGGPYAGTPSYNYDIGPDHNSYAVSGEVPIDVAPISGDPEATVAKMRIVEAAAMAPPEPSATDRAVAALARARMLQAQAELAAAARTDRDGMSLRL
jgi:hypothetical protein